MRRRPRRGSRAPGRAGRCRCARRAPSRPRWTGLKGTRASLAAACDGLHTLHTENREDAPRDRLGDGHGAPAAWGPRLARGARRRRADRGVDRRPLCSRAGVHDAVDRTGRDGLRDARRGALDARDARAAHPSVPVLQPPHARPDRSAARGLRPRRRHPVGPAPPGTRHVARRAADVPLGAPRRITLVGGRRGRARARGTRAPLLGVPHDRAVDADRRHRRAAHAGAGARGAVHVALRRVRRLGDGSRGGAPPGAHPAPGVPARSRRRLSRRRGPHAPAAPASVRRAGAWPRP